MVLNNWLRVKLCGFCFAILCLPGCGIRIEKQPVDGGAAAAPTPNGEDAGAPGDAGVSSGAAQTVPSPTPPEVAIPPEFPAELSEIENAFPVNLKASQGMFQLTLLSRADPANIIHSLHQKLQDAEWGNLKIEQYTLLQTPVQALSAHKANYTAVITALPADRNRVKDYDRLKTFGNVVLNVNLYEKPQMQDDVPVHEQALLSHITPHDGSAPEIVYRVPGEMVSVYQHHVRALVQNGWTIAEQGQWVEIMQQHLRAKKGNRTLDLTVRGKGDSFTRIPPGEVHVTYNLN